MSLLDNFGSLLGNGIKDVKGLENSKVPTAGEMFIETLRLTSGASHERTNKGVYYNIIGFRGVCDGYGTSILVANTALALAEYGLRVCVIDTSILKPVQDLYLQTGVREKEPKKIKDWFDMPFTHENVLSVSKLNKNINVLSFTNRTILDLLSTSDTEDLTTIAFRQLESKFDVLLVDICNEPSAVAITAMQRSHVIFQVWGNDVQCLNSVSSFITNATTLACTSDKLKYVITSNVVDDIPTNWKSVLENYNFTHLAQVGSSRDIARVCATGEPLWNYPSKSEDIIEFNHCIATICNKILGLDVDLNRGSVSTDEILDGKIDGTLTRLLKFLSPQEEEIQNAIESQTESAIKSLEDAEGVAKGDAEVDKVEAKETTEAVAMKVKEKKSFFGHSKRG